MNAVLLVCSFLFGIGVGGLVATLIIAKREGWFK